MDKGVSTVGEGGRERGRKKVGEKVVNRRGRERERQGERS